MTNSTKGVLAIRVGMMRVFFLVAVALVSSAAIVTVPRPVHADAVVGRGTPNSCTEASLDAALSCNPSGTCRGNGNVTFNCGGGPVTITVTSLETLVGEASIDGGGLVTLDCGGTTPLFVVSVGTLSLSNLIISGGRGGTGGAISINAGGTLTVTNSTFSGNRGIIGGAISSSGTLTVTNSTFSGNSANGGNGGAIADFAAFAAVNVTNSTFSGNSANGGNGGAIYWSGNPLGPMGHPVTVTNTIFSNSTGGNCYVKPDSIIVGGTGNTGAITDGGHNLEDGKSCGFRTANGSLSSTNALLDPTGLRNNGGPTQTVALEPGSPAIDSGDQAVCAAAPVNDLDQRGFARPGTGATNCSIGAFEFYPPPTARPTPSRTPTPTLPPPTLTPAKTRTPTRSRTPTRTPTLGPCVGDCDTNGMVTVDELVKGVNMALGNLTLDQCPQFDCNGHHQVSVDCLVKAVNSTLRGCSG